MSAYLPLFGRLLYRYDDSVGVKTGYTRQAGNCVVGAAKRGEMLLVAVSINSPTVYEDLEHLFEFGFDNYHVVSLGKASEISQKVMVDNGDSQIVTAIPKANIQMSVTNEEVPYLAYRLEVMPEVTAPVMAGDRLGTCILYLKGEQVGSIDLIAQNQINLKQSSASVSLILETISSKWLLVLVSLILFILCFKKSTRLQNSLRRLILILLRRRIPSQYRRHHY